MTDIAGAEEALKRYDLGKIVGLCRIPIGLIHQTFLVESAGSKFILQRLHPDLSADALLEDYASVTDYLGEKSFPAPRLVRTKDGKAFSEGPDGRYRLITHLAGEFSEFVDSAWMAGEAAKMLGTFHSALNEFRYRFQHSRPLHDSAAHLESFRAAVRQNAAAPQREELADVIRRIEENLPRHLLPAPLPARVVHGDPKISNVAFDLKRREAIGLVDLDSCARHTALVDLGDAVRSWCRNGPEDEPSPFLIDRFEAVLDGYRRSDAALSGMERALLVQACLLIPLELAARFVRDVFEDRYFGWDEKRFPSRRAHNAARARGCVALYDSMLKQREDMEGKVKKYLGTVGV